jgi:hypothetical protein
LGHVVALPAIGTVSREVSGMARTTQRDVMRDLYRRVGGDRHKTVAVYAAAERRGDVTPA